MNVYSKVKVESRDAPDAGRSVYPRAMRNGEGVLHLTVNRNKRGICLDVKTPEEWQRMLSAKLPLVVNWAFLGRPMPEDADITLS